MAGLVVRARGRPRCRGRRAPRRTPASGVPRRSADEPVPAAGQRVVDVGARTVVDEDGPGPQQVALAGALSIWWLTTLAPATCLLHRCVSTNLQIDGSSATASNTARALPSSRWLTGSTGKAHQWSCLGVQRLLVVRTRRDRSGPRIATRPSGQCPDREAAVEVPRRATRAAGCAPSRRRQRPGRPASTRSFQSLEVGLGERVLVEELPLEEREAVAHQVERRVAVDRVVGQDPVDERREVVARRGSGSARCRSRT